MHQKIIPQRPDAPAGIVLGLLEKIETAQKKEDVPKIRMLVEQVLDALDLEETLLYIADEPGGLAS